MFRHPEDRLPTLIILSLTALDLLVFALVEEAWMLAGYWLVLVIPKGIIGAWSHHHQHCPTFRFRLLNRLLELSHALHTGQTTNLWVLHHVFGHHLNYLDQSKDESRWKKKSGRTMGVVEYTLEVAFTSYYRAFRVGTRYPRYLKPFVTWGGITVALVVALTWLRPVQGFFVFVLPMVTSLVWTSWVTYDHHAGLDVDDPLEASFNILNPWYNKLTGNLGYHTAHHLKQGVHWSMLPEVHEALAPSIPEHLFRPSTFDLFLPDKL